MASMKREGQQTVMRPISVESWVVSCIEQKECQVGDLDEVSVRSIGLRILLENGLEVE